MVAAVAISTLRSGINDIARASLWTFLHFVAFVNQRITTSSRAMFRAGFTKFYTKLMFSRSFPDVLLGLTPYVALEVHSTFSPDSRLARSIRLRPRGNRSGAHNSVFFSSSFLQKSLPKNTSAGCHRDAVFGQGSLAFVTFHERWTFLSLPSLLIFAFQDIHGISLDWPPSDIFFFCTIASCSSPS